MAEGTRELLAQLKVEPRFKDKIPPLLSEEFARLRENIIEAGEVYEPIRVWKGVVIDGHHRLKVISENPEIKWRTLDMDFADEWAAYEWIYRNQIGRRNLTDNQRHYMIGKMYEARKHLQGGTGANQHTARSKQTGQNVHSATRRETKDGTSGVIGKELGIDGRTVRRAEKYATGIDTLREASQEAAEKILKGEANVSRMEVQQLSNASEAEVQEAVDAILSGMKRIAQPTRPEPVYGLIEQPRVYTPETSAYNIDDLIEEVNENGKGYVESLRRHIETRFSQFDTTDNREKLRHAINTIIDAFKKLKEEYR